MKQSYLVILFCWIGSWEERFAQIDDWQTMHNGWPVLHLSHMNKLVFLEEYLDISTHLLADNTKYTFNNNCILFFKPMIPYIVIQFE